ncbi:MAG: heme ABC transporter ATP-binding protein [Arcanobacterium sp.]|nr:heme ABC transporter ATP-binding protein [Arcanobacterium sp.]
MSILEARHVVFRYGKRSILSDVSLCADRGKMIGLLGPNGAGKSTLLKVLSGDLIPSSGTVLIDGLPLASYSRVSLAQMRAVMPQSSTFPFAYLVRDIVAMARTSWDTSREYDEQRVAQALDDTGITHLRERDVTTLSGGEKARVTLARVIAQESTVVFLDEPTAALDIAHQERTMELCRELVAQGCALVAVMHDISLAAAYCDQLCLLSDGEIAAMGDPSDVLKDDILSTVYHWPISVHRSGGEWLVQPRRTASVC